MGDMQNTSATNFIVEELSWVIGNRSRITASLLRVDSASLPGHDRKHALQVLGLEQRGPRF